MRKCVMCLFVLVVCMGQQCTPSSGTFDEGGNEELIWTNTNSGGVSSGPTASTTFTLANSAKITKVRTYHYNGGAGVSAVGTISLQSAGGTAYGAYSATGSDGQGGASNAYWDCTPNVELAAGTYTIIDSDNSTWSTNSQAENAGIAWVYGYDSSSGGSTDESALDKLHECDYMSVFVYAEHHDSTGWEFASGFVGMSCGMYSSSSYGTVKGKVVWNGTSFTATGENENGSATLSITGQVGSDGRSIYNVNAVFRATGNFDFHDEIVTNSSSVPLITDRAGYWPVGSSWPDTLNMLFEVTGSGVQNYITKIVSESYDYSYTNWDSTETTPKLEIRFRPLRDDE